MMKRKTKPKSKRSSAPAKKAILTPPPKLPEEVEQLFANHDFIELEYRQMALLRKRRKATPDQRKKLAEHDEVERQIEEEPNEVFREAHEAIDRGTSLLLKLIRSHKFYHRYLDTDGKVCVEYDEALDCLTSRMEFLNLELMRLARARKPKACQNSLGIKRRP